MGNPPKVEKGGSETEKTGIKAGWKLGFSAAAKRRCSGGRLHSLKVPFCFSFGLRVSTA